MTGKTAVTGSTLKKAAAKPEANGRPFSRAVLWTGTALGAFLATETLLHGLVLPLGVNAILNAAITVVLIVALGVVLAELIRRHHRAIARHGWRYGKAGARATARGTARGAGVVARSTARGAGMVARRTAARSRPWRTRAMDVIRARWAARGAAREAKPKGNAGAGDCPGCGRPLSPDGDCPRCGASAEPGRTDDDGRTWSWGLAGARAHWPAPSRDEAEKWARRMSGDGKPRAVAEYPSGGGPGRTVATYVNGKPVPSDTGGNTTMSPSKIAPERRARRNAARTGGHVPSEWGPVIAQTADFEPEDDGQLLQWMTRQITGLSGWAEALVDFYEHCTQVIGIDPKASTMLHDVADAAAQAAETMGAAKTRFTEHYELPREFAANGGLMTHDGRWVTGDGA